MSNQIAASGVLALQFEFELNRGAMSMRSKHTAGSLRPGSRLKAELHCELQNAMGEHAGIQTRLAVEADGSHGHAARQLADGEQGINAIERTAGHGDIRLPED